MSVPKSWEQTVKRNRSPCPFPPSYLSSLFNGFHCREASGERVRHRGQGPDFLPQMCDPRQIYQNLGVSVYSGVRRVSTDPSAKCKCLSLPYWIDIMATVN